MNKTKLKMRNGKFRAIIIPIISVLSIIAVAASIAADIFSLNLDMFLGKGQKHIASIEGSESWNTDYYNQQYTTVEESVAAGNKIAVELSEEGSVLLKNNGILPLAANSAIMPFGYGYLNPVYGQVDFWGSGKWSTPNSGVMTEATNPTTPAQALAQKYSVKDNAINAMNGATPVSLAAASGTSAPTDGKIFGILGSDSQIIEYNPSIYSGIASQNDTTGFVLISRSGSEGVEKKYDGYEDCTPHYLALSEYEKETIKAAKRICGKVIVVLNSSAPMELAPIMGSDKEYEADAILWVGHPGEHGFEALPSLLTGEVNPSGKTPDIYPSDFTADPSYQNIGSFYYSNVNNATGSAAPYVEYQEGIYIGYRYYETAHDISAKNFVYGEIDDKGSMKTSGAVTYPFGYGLSYSTFSQEIVSFSETEETINIDVKVTNNSDVPGKDIVQLYLTAPYTQFDINNKIEKSTVNLIAFQKTELISSQPEIISFSIAKEDFASYCYTHDNGNGTRGCYVLESGDYTISLRSDSHTVIEEKTVRITDTFWYDGSDNDHIRKSDLDAQSATDNDGNSIGLPASYEADKSATYQAVYNQFEYMTEYMNEESSLLTRSDWNNTQPNTTSKVKSISQKFADKLNAPNNFDYATDPELGNVEGSKVYAKDAPLSNQDNGLSLSDMRGKSFYDESWDKLLDQIDWDADEDNIRALFTKAAYNTAEIPSIGLMSTSEYDGLNGIKVPSGTSYDMSKSTTFGFAPLMAASFNTKLLEKIGEAIANDCLVNNINGLYAPGVNLHRSYFNGRVFEYYSEDPLLSGKLASAFISGAANKGMFCDMKHFALNDTETNRSNQLHSWADEQTMRELYLKAFEIPVKEAKYSLNYIADVNGTMTSKTMRATTAIMACQNEVGAYYGHCNYTLLTTVLRGEWGFNGVVVSDYFDNEESNRDFALRAGCDTYLSASTVGINDYTSATARSVMRNAIHRLCYTVVNSNAMQGMAPGSIVYYDISPWKIALIVADVSIGVIVLGCITWMILRTLDEKKHPENYKTK